MLLLRRVLIIIFSTLIVSSCGGGGDDVASGGGSGLGGSGFGGTGISLVKGNIASVNGQTISKSKARSDFGKEILVARLFSAAAYAQSFMSRNITVSGGGVSSGVDQSGQFQLLNVTPAANFVLTFEIEGEGTVTLSIGQVAEASAVNVPNVRINTASGSAASDGVSSESTKNNSALDSDDGNSEDDDFSDESDDDSEDDDISEDVPDADDEISEDDNSDDD